jgi:hypothetical protein
MLARIQAFSSRAPKSASAQKEKAAPEGAAKFREETSKKQHRLSDAA